MSRSGYSDDCDDAWDMIKWHGQLASVIRGKRGQAFLRELVGALDALPEKRLIVHELEDSQGEVCALGALGKKRQLDMKDIDPEDYDTVSNVFNIAHQLAREIAYENDEGCNDWRQTAEERFRRMRTWVASLIVVTPEECGAIEIDDNFAA